MKDTNLAATVSKEKNVKKTYISVLNVLASLSVVCLHMSGFWNFSRDVRWVISNMIECLFYFAVPVFFMITGATLLDYRKRYSTKTYLAKRMKKTLIPFLAFSVFSFLFFMGIQLIKQGSFPTVTAASFVNGIINCEYMDIYWFFPCIFSVYLVIPILSYIPEQHRKTAFEYMICGAFLLQILLPFVFSFLSEDIRFNGDFSFPVAGGYMIYVLLGYYIDNYEIPKKIRFLIYGLGICGFLVHFFGTWMLSWQMQEVSRFFKGYLSLCPLLYSVAVFLLFKHLNFDVLPKTVEKIYLYLNGQTFGIYLIHMYFIRIISTLFSQTSIPQYGLYPYVFMFIGPIVVFTLCGLLVKLMQKIPLVKDLVP